MKKIINRVIKSMVICALIFVFSILLLGGIVAYAMPDNYKTDTSETITFTDNLVPLSIKSTKSDAITASAPNSSKSLTPKLMLFNEIPVKEVNLTVEPEETVILQGVPFGIKIYTDGVLVVGTSEVKTQDGVVSPADEANISIGDVIMSMDGQKVTTNEEVSDIVSNSNGNAIELQVARGNETFTSELQPRQSVETGEIKAGLWVRDSSAGIGMLTYYNPANNTFGGLGHGICDTDTEQLMPLLTGDIVNASISAIDKSKSGYPGQLHGSFSNKESIGTLQINNDEGVYGTMDSAICEGISCTVANKQDVQKGNAQILTTVEGSEPQLFDINITNINYNENSPTKNMVIEITDEELLEKTGGIVQGMSGSPIIQDGKFVGAVTHVFVNEPQKGYAIFADNMLDQSDSLTAYNNAA